MIKILAVASEVHPIIKTGGLADVVGALAGGLAAREVTVTTLVPGYPAVLAALQNPERVTRFDDCFGGKAVLKRGTAAELISSSWIRRTSMIGPAIPTPVLTAGLAG